VVAAARNVLARLKITAHLPAALFAGNAHIRIRELAPLFICSLVSGA
jgi:hypothetical protein